MRDPFYSIFCSFKLGPEALSVWLLVVCANNLIARRVLCLISFSFTPPSDFVAFFLLCCLFLLSVACGSFQFVFIAVNPLKRFRVAFSLLCVKKNVFDFCCLLCSFVSLFPCFGFCFLICRIPDLRFASHLALCVRLSGRGRKKAPEVQKKTSRGSKKDAGFATRCFGAEERLLKIMHRG